MFAALPVEDFIPGMASASKVTRLEDMEEEARFDCSHKTAAEGRSITPRLPPFFFFCSAVYWRHHQWVHHSIHGCRINTATQ